MKYLFTLLFTAGLFAACRSSETNTATLKNYFATDTSGVADGGVQVIPITTPKGTFKVWTKRFGNNPTIKITPAERWPRCYT